MGNTFAAMAYTWRKEGPKALLAPWAPGYASTCADAFVFNFVYYYYFEFFRSIYQSKVGGSKPLINFSGMNIHKSKLF